MPRTFNDSLEADLTAVFFNADEFAVLVDVRRGHRTTQNVPAIVVQRVYQVKDDEAQLQIQSLDFDIAVSAYQIESEEVEPRDGDQITLDGRVYQVLPIQMDGATPPQSHELVGGSGHIWRIHTKRMR